MSAFVAKQLEKIQARRELKWKQNAKLSHKVSEALKAVVNSKPVSTTETQHAGDNSLILPSSQTLDGCLPSQDEKYINTDLYLATLLECCRSGIPQVQIVALDSIQKLIAFGHISGEENEVGNNRSEAVIKSVCDSFKGTGSDEEVSLQLLKVILTAVTANKFPVHGQTLLFCVKTSYNVALASKSLVNQATARAALTQTVTGLFQRMENEAIQENFQTVQQCEVEEEKSEENSIENGADKNDKNSDSDDPDSITLDNFGKILVEDIIKKACDIIDPPPKFPDKHGFQSELQVDCFIVLRSLCRLSNKTIEGAEASSGPTSQIDPKSHELRSKVLSLQLIKSALQQCGLVFKTHPAFLSCVRQYLCVAMSRNGLSPVQEVFELSIAIILHLLHDFRTHLKPQVEAFFSEIFLALLEAQGTAPVQRLLVVQAMTRVTNDAQLLTDLYVNYDCGMKSVNVFEKLVSILVKLANDHSVQAKTIRAHSLECIINVLKCLVEWSREIYTCPGIQSKADHGKEVNKTKIPESDFDGKVDSENASIHSGGIEQMKEEKALLENGIALFNKKPKKGVQFFIDTKIIVINEESKRDIIIAEFLMDESRLDPKSKGDYLGETANLEVMYSYVDLFNWNDLDIVAALRSFLESFQLPGEAQKVDRLMEKFAARYLECNNQSSIFASADAAYVLCFSIIMLATDLHSDQIKKKMTIEDYIKMNRGINEQRDLPKEYLEEIYGQIKSRPIQLKGGKSAKALVKGNDKLEMTDKEKVNAARIERTQMEEDARAALEEAMNVDEFWSHAKDVMMARPMFKAIWQPTLVALSRSIQEESQVVDPRACLDGLQCAIRLAGMFEMVTARQSFIQALTRFSLLQPETLSTANENITPKNIEAIKALLAVAITCGNYLEESWSVVLRCVSKLELLQLVGQGVPDVDLQASGKHRNSKKTHQNNQINNLSETACQSVVKAVDTIFTRSCGLEGDAVVHFAKALCEVSSEELFVTKPARMFSLQKLVEISYYNMGRVRFQWQKFWMVVGDHFQKAACSENSKVSMYAVDSLRQISLKFLEKGELKNFRFQKEFLRPFEIIVRGGRNLVVRDLVVRCAQQFVEARAPALRSGWRNILAVLGAASHEPALANIAFPVVVRCALELQNGEVQLHSLAPSWNDLVKCLGDFAVTSEEHSMESLKILRNLSDKVGNKDLFEKENIATDERLPDLPLDDRVWARAWFPLLFELTTIITRSSLDVRTRALSVLFEIIKTHGATFEQYWWEDLFQIIFKTLEGDPDNNFELEMEGNAHLKNNIKQWRATTCQHCLIALSDTIVLHKLKGVLLKRTLDKLRWACTLKVEPLSSAATNCVQTLFSGLAAVMDEEEEYSLAVCSKDLRDICEASPTVLLELVQAITNALLDEQIQPLNSLEDDHYAPPSPIKPAESPFNIGLISLKLKTVLLLIQTILECSRCSIEAQNADSPPEVILKLETTAMMQGLRCLYKLYSYKPEEEKVLQTVLDAECMAMKRVSREPSKWKNIGRFVLDRITTIEDKEEFITRAKRLHPSFCKMINHPFPNDVTTPLRIGLQAYFEKVGEFAGLGTPPGRKGSK